MVQKSMQYYEVMLDCAAGDDENVSGDGSRYFLEYAPDSDTKKLFKKQVHLVQLLPPLRSPLMSAI